MSTRIELLIIFHCFPETLPSQPQASQGTLDADLYIVVQWKPPAVHAETVEKYIVYYQNAANTYNCTVVRAD